MSHAQSRPIPQEVIAQLLTNNLGLRAGERLVVVTDTLSKHIGSAFFEAGATIGAITILVVISPTERNGSEPPAAAAAAMLHADVIVCPTLFSLSHTQARLRATQGGARIATMPGIHTDMFFDGPIAADYWGLERRTSKLADLMTTANSVRLVSGDTSVLTFSIKGRPGRASTGRLVSPGAFGNLPSGEAYCAPLEGTASGELVVNGSVAGIGIVSAPFKIHIKDGLLTEAEGSTGAQLLALLGNAPGARNIAEFGIGTNDKARLTGVVLEDEKALGTIHIAFGDNSTFGGAVVAGVHIDSVVVSPSVYLDDTQIIDRGRLMV